MPLFTNPVAFVILYLVAIIPSYILPYLGSNSSVINATGAALGIGFTVFFWLHVTTLYLACIIAWFRGLSIGKPWLPIFPFLAAVFDLSPGFTWIPLVPTLFHVLALILGVIGESKQYRFKMYQLAGAAAGLVLGVSLVLMQAAAYEDSAKQVVHQFKEAAEAQGVPPKVMGQSPATAQPSASTAKVAKTAYLKAISMFPGEYECSLEELDRDIKKLTAYAEKFPRSEYALLALKDAIFKNLYGSNCENGTSQKAYRYRRTARQLLATIKNDFPGSAAIAEAEERFSMFDVVADKDN
jgi:hypothetical protein